MFQVECRSVAYFARRFSLLTSGANRVLHIRRMWDHSLMSKTNACRILDSLGIAYELREYTVDPDDLSAENVAAKVGLPPEQVFKTLAVRETAKEFRWPSFPAATSSI